MSIQDFLSYIIKQIVSFPTEVLVERNMNTYDETYVIHANPSDIGILIGKQGKNINAIRNLIAVKSAGNRVFIKIAEQEQPL